ncbi:MAG: hypothetical protein ACJAWS_002089 [Oleiphilaceae bacterium]|jgi:hypothetical protein
MDKQEFKTEWCLLQNQFDSYEKHSLYIKLLGVIFLFVSVLLGVTSLFIVLVLAVLWLQDAIWKTFQSRIETRLLVVETYISEKTEARPFQFNSEFLKVRLGGLSLITEYIRQAVRPTVAFPYVVLIFVFLISYML